MGLGWDLAHAEMSERRGTFAALAAGLALAVAAGGLTTTLVAGVQDAITREVEALVTGDVRITRASLDLGAGRLDDGLAFVANDARALGADAAVRLELEGIVTNGSAAASGSGVLLVGVAADDPLALSDRLVAGAIPRPERVWVHGQPFVPVVVGAPLRDRMGLAVHEGDGPVRGAARLNVTAGHLTLSGGRLTPVVLPGVVVGVYDTGFRALDKGVVFVPIEAARELIDHHPDGTTANALVAAGPVGPLRDLAAERGMIATTATDFQRAWLGPIYDAVDVFTLATVALLLVLGAAWIGSSIATHIAHDARRYATLLAVGIPPPVLRASWMASALAVGAVGAAAGLAATLGVVMVGSGFDLPTGGGASLAVLLPLRPGALVILGVVAVLVALAATRLALVRLDRLSIVGALKA